MIVTDNQSASKLQKFAALFAGRTDAYGSLTGACIKRPVTLQVYARHLAGKESIGIYPLRDDGTCWFAAQDIDMKDDQAKAAEMAGAVKETLAELGIPAYIEKSKSKGYHIWLFFSEPVPAKDARRLLAGVWKKAVGGSVPEIFPKQDTLEGQTYGNYIHLPFFRPHSKENRRVMVDGGRVLSLEEFLNSVRRVTPEQLAAALEKLPAEKESPNKAAAPGAKGGHRDLLPCAKALVEKGADKGYRRPSLFRLAAHCHKAGYPQEIAEALIKQVDAKNDPPILEEFGEKELLHHLESAYSGKGGKGYTSLGCDDAAWTSRFCPGKESCPVHCDKSKKQPPKPVYTALANVTPEAVTCLWEPYLPVGKLVIIEGDPEAGKTWVALAICSKLTRQGKTVLYTTAEDGIADTIRNRVAGMDADLTKFYVLQGALQGQKNGEDELLPVSLDTPVVLETAIQELKPALVVLDPIQAFLGTGIDMHKANQVRSRLAILTRLAETYKCTFLVLRHLTKTAMDRAIYRGLGSIDFTAAARSVLLVGKNQEGQRAVVQIKNSLGEYGPALGFEIRQGQFFWLGEVNITAGDILHPETDQEEKTVLEEAVEWLQDFLSTGPREKKEIEQQARAAGIIGNSDILLRRAKSKLRVRSIPVKEVNEKGKLVVKSWQWELPDDENSRCSSGEKSSLYIYEQLENEPAKPTAASTSSRCSLDDSMSNWKDPSNIKASGVHVPDAHQRYSDTKTGDEQLETEVWEI
ncbi:MAG: AAA family ATPase [Armatimonadetes bacterium]|nr:AAA family ATPase [Armatimonadota bacterium]